MFQKFYISKQNYRIFLNVLFIGLGLFCFSACKTSQTHKEYNKVSTGFDTLALTNMFTPLVYQPSPTLINDLIHTKLELNIDWTKAYVYGKATISFKPHFYSDNHINIDAVGFDINEIALINKTNKKPLHYTYDNKKVLSIDLGQTFQRTDTVTIYIDYVAKPEEQASGGSDAIGNDRGLYFINKLGKDPHKPMQIWSQGETQSNSRWFPTIDVPNQRMTQEIYLTVDKKYVTLSNGLLISQKDNNDGTRTDYWKQSLSAPPYLSMIAIGNFAIVKDKWHNIEVNYYVEPDYAKYAKHIFGNTPEMMTYFSDLLGMPYQWEKYAQIAVRDYVSGAMENTTATLHSEDIQRTDKELLDANGDDVISHELFHHWFGDLVTCESWSNLPLNESFADYSEYLWLSHKYGQEEGDFHLMEDLNQYLDESRMKKVNMIRFYYSDKEQMFDSHSYSKGGRILHMLRNYVGDDAFFASLKLYLETKKFESAEIEDLRLAFEKVTGEDLHWFFNQWFLANGHPDLLIQHHYNDTTKKYEITITQKQNLSTTPLYRLPIKVDLYYGDKKERKSIEISKEAETFSFDCPKKPLLAIVDAERVLLCIRDEYKPINEWIYQYNNAPLFVDRYEAIKKIRMEKGDGVFDCLVKACKDKHHRIREMAIEALFTYHKNENENQQKQLFTEIATKDEHHAVRASALEALGTMFKNDKGINEIFIKALDDKSYHVQSEALDDLNDIDPALGFEMAKKFDADSNINLVRIVAKIYTTSGSDAENDYFIRNYQRISGHDKYDIIDLYGTYLLGRKDETINKGIALLERDARENTLWYIKLAAMNKLNQLNDMYTKREGETNGKTDKQLEYESSKSQHEKLTALIDSIKKAETNKNLLEIYKN